MSGQRADSSYINLNASAGKTGGGWLLFLYVSEELGTVVGPAHQVECLLDGGEDIHSSSNVGGGGWVVERA